MLFLFLPPTLSLLATCQAITLWTWTTLDSTLWTPFLSPMNEFDYPERMVESWRLTMLVQGRMLSLVDFKVNRHCYCSDSFRSVLPSPATNPPSPPPLHWIRIFTISSRVYSNGLPKEQDGWLCAEAARERNILSLNASENVLSTWRRSPRVLSFEVSSAKSSLPVAFLFRSPEVGEEIRHLNSKTRWQIVLKRGRRKDTEEDVKEIKQTLCKLGRHFLFVLERMRKWNQRPERPLEGDIFNRILGRFRFSPSLLD